jgi:hypothetical protein
VIVDLRVLVMSGVWRQAHQAYLGSRPLPGTVEMPSQVPGTAKVFKKAG